MKYRRLGSTDLEVSVVGIGTWQYGGEWGRSFSQQEVDAILGRAGELGINLIDTAECYGDHLSERLVGKAISGERDRWIVATKFGHEFHAPFQRTERWSASEVLAQLDASLEALGTDYVDLYQFHSGSDEVFDNEELWQALAEQVRLGRVRHLGISVKKQDNEYQVGRAGDVGARAIQVIYNRLDRALEERVLPECRERDLGVLARVPLASGYLSGKYRPGTSFSDESDTRSRHDADEVRRTLEEVERIRRDEVPESVPMPAWALSWCLRHPAVTCVIPGCKSVEQVESNALASELVSPGHPQDVPG
jgi:aryl-alcohol dehydrogenase-like predicted oxidoreductase